MGGAKVTTDTIARTIVLAIALLNQVLTMVGLNPLPIAEADVYQLCTIVATVGASLWAWWRNNSFTVEAIRADEFKKKIS